MKPPAVAGCAKPLELSPSGVVLLDFSPFLAGDLAGGYSDRMRQTPFLVAVLIGWAVSPASAVEYRLDVASLQEDGFTHFIDGPILTGSGELIMARLERALDAGEVGSGARMGDRVPTRFRAGAAESFGAVRVRGDVNPAEGARQWDEIVWEGKPGERSVWVIATTTTHVQEVKHVALKGWQPGSALRYYIPYRVTLNPTPESVVAFPLPFIRFYEDRPGLWERYLSKSVGLGEGIAVLVGINETPGFADWVYLIVQHPPQPATFKAVLGWGRRMSGDKSSKEGRDP